MKNQVIKVMFLFCLLTFCASLVKSQNGKLIGVIENVLVEISPIDGSISHILDINKPGNVSIFNLTYSSSSCLFYGVIDIATAPKLISIDWSGNYTVIGLMSVPGKTIYFCEALAVNPSDNKLYAGISFDGSPPTSETIIELNPLTGEAIVVSELGPNSTMQNDFDHFTFIENELFLHDGAPDIFEASKLYKIDFQNIGPISFATELYDTTYKSFKDLASIGDLIYMPTGDFELYVWDTQFNSLSYIGQTHNSQDYNGNSFGGLEYVEFNELELFGYDTVLCSNETMEIYIDLSDAIVKWNNGMEGSSILINSPGSYWADIMVDDCYYISDTVNVDFQDCGSCNYFIPTAFSPQGDGVNDEFKVYYDTVSCSIESIKISVFDRWGCLLIETMENKWDGYFNGKKLNQGIYVYKVEIAINQNGVVRNEVEYGTVNMLK